VRQDLAMPAGGSHSYPMQAIGEDCCQNGISVLVRERFLGAKQRHLLLAQRQINFQKLI
jgi:hypothetical protein